MDVAGLGEEASPGRCLTLLIIPGFMGTAAGWRPFLSYLGPTIRIEWWFPERQPLDQSIRLLRRRLSRSRTRPLVALGYSQGARLLFSAMQDQRAWPDAAILLSARLPLADTLDRARRRAVDRRRARLLRRVGMPNFLTWWRALPVIRSQQRAAPELRAQRRAERLRLDAERTARVLETLGAGNFRPPGDSAIIDVPVLAVAGAEDVACCRTLQKWSQVFVESEQHIIAASGHAPQFEQPLYTARAVSRFLARLSAGPRHVAPSGNR